MRRHWMLPAATGVVLTLLGAVPEGARAQADGDVALARELEAVRAATARFRDVEEAKRAGYARSRFGMDPPLMGEHWVNRELLGRPVDLLRPAVLQYVRVGERRELVGVAYGVWQAPGAELPPGFTGSGDAWHTHDMPELVRRLTRHRPWAVRQAVDLRLATGGWSGGEGRTELAMLHVWLWSPNPDGIFANFNPALPYLRAGLPPEWAAPADHAAARGVQLLAPDACPAAAKGLQRLLGGSAERQQGWERECGAARDRLSMARTAGSGPAGFNRAAALAWRQFTGAVRSGLTEAERAELGALSEGELGGGARHHHQTDH